MAEKNIKSRVVLKHDISSNWQLATGFTPLKGEVVIYDPDESCSYSRVKVGDGVHNINSLPFIDANKVDKVAGKGLSTNDYTTTEKNKLAGIAEGANKTVVDSALSSTSTNPVQNKVIYDKLEELTDMTPVSEQIATAIANKVDKVSGKGLSTNDYTTDEKNKLSGIASGAEVNQNAFSNISVGSTTISADTKTDTLTLVAGSNITITPDATNDKITIAATDTVYTHPTSGVTAGTYKSVTVNAHGHVTDGTNPTTLSGYGITDGATKTEVNTALTNAKSYTDAEITEWVGDKKVSEQITTAIANKSDADHNHDSAYDKKGAADTALASAKTYADSAATKVKNDLLNGAGTAYDTLKELGDLIDDNIDAIEALEAVAANKANTSDLTAHTSNKSNPHGVTAAQISAVPTSRKVNGKALSADITLSASDVGADVSGAASTALTNAKAYTDAEITEWVGDKKVSEQISTAIGGITHPVTSVNSKTGAVTLSASDVSAVPTTRKVNGKALSSDITLSASDVGAAASSHGTHVPTPETANNAKFLRNDNTWQTVTPANIGAAASSHGTHVTYSTTAPVMDGTASVGSASTVARSDHKHPTDTSRAAASDLAALHGLVGDTKVSDQISSAINKATADDFGIYVQATEPTNAVAGDIWVDTANDPSYIPPTIPAITAADNGKVLMVVNGTLQLVNLNLSIDANGVVSM